MLLAFRAPHLHHLAARNLHRAGCSLRDVQLLAGHCSIDLTQRYIEGFARAATSSRHGLAHRSRHPALRRQGEHLSIKASQIDLICAERRGVREPHA